MGQKGQHDRINVCANSPTVVHVSLLATLNTPPKRHQWKCHPHGRRQIHQLGYLELETNKRQRSERESECEGEMKQKEKKTGELDKDKHCTLRQCQLLRKSLAYCVAFFPSGKMLKRTLAF